MNSTLTYRGRKGDWIQTYTGQAFWDFDPRPEEVCIEDIAHALAFQCRYGGHSKRFYSVAEHCYWVSQLCSEENAFAGLMHDRTEAYLIDLPRPIKWHLPEYKTLEAVLDIVTAVPFGLAVPMPDEVKQIDNAILACERNQLMSHNGTPFDWEILTTVKVDVELACWRPEEAEERFLERFGLLHEASQERTQ
jgi:hypothetical protein